VETGRSNVRTVLGARHVRSKARAGATIAAFRREEVGRRERQTHGILQLRKGNSAMWRPTCVPTRFAKELWEGGEVAARESELGL
jgi:hypothetical protein